MDDDDGSSTSGTSSSEHQLSYNEDLDINPSKKEKISRAVFACQSGDLATVSGLLEDGLSVNEIDKDGCSFLHWAAINNRLDIIDRLLAGGANVNQIGGYLQSTPLHWAAHSRNFIACGMLVQAGANGLLQDKDGYCPLHIAVKNGASLIVAYLLIRFRAAKEVCEKTGRTPLMIAAAHVHNRFPLRTIIEFEVDLNAVERTAGDTALHIAIRCSNHSAVRDLLEAGADFEVANFEGVTPLMMSYNLEDKQIEGCFNEAYRRKYGCYLERPPVCNIVKKFIFAVAPALGWISAYLLFFYLHFAIVFGVFLCAAILFFFLNKSHHFFHALSSSVFPIGYLVAGSLTEVFLWCYLLIYQGFTPWWTHIPFFFFKISGFLLFLKVLLCDPGVLRKSTDGQETFARRVEARELAVVCLTCWVDKPRKSKHCAVCDRCVAYFDHHCPWTNQCITRRNQREFVGFLFCAVVVNVIYPIAMGTLIVFEFQRLELLEWIQSYCFLGITVLLAAGYSYAFAMVIYNQLNQVSYDTTTNEQVRAKRTAATTSATGPTPSATQNGPSMADAFRHQNVQHSNIDWRQRLRNIRDFFENPIPNDSA